MKMISGSRQGIFVSLVIFGAVLAAGSFHHAQAASNVEPICPGGSAPRPDIIVCEDFENLGSSIYKAQSNWTIVNGGAAAGDSYLAATGAPFGFGTGYEEPYFPQLSQNTKKINFRFLCARS